MKASSFNYLLKEGVRNLWKNRVMSFTSIGVLTTCLLIVGAAYLVTINVNSMVHFVENQNEMSAFAKLGTSDQRLKELDQEIKAIPNVASVEFVPPEEGIQEYMEGDLENLLSDYLDRPDNPIPSFFKVSVEDISRTAETQAAISKLDGIEVVKASSGMADTLTGMRNIVTMVGSSIILALGIISLVIIANTIRATIFSRRKEINIMKYVGATNSFIRIPFLVEGFLLGLTSAALSYLVIWGSYSYLIGMLTSDASSFLASMFDSIVPFKDFAVSLALFFGVTGTVLGTFGSAISVRNHVRV